VIGERLTRALPASFVSTSKQRVDSVVGAGETRWFKLASSFGIQRSPTISIWLFEPRPAGVRCPEFTSAYFAAC